MLTKSQLIKSIWLCDNDMVCVNVYDIKWNFLRCYWMSEKQAAKAPAGHYRMQGKEIHKMMTC
jgi:hypothetical protein